MVTQKILQIQFGIPSTLTLRRFHLISSRSFLAFLSSSLMDNSSLTLANFLSSLRIRKWISSRDSFLFAFTETAFLQTDVI